MLLQTKSMPLAAHRTVGTISLVGAISEVDSNVPLPGGTAAGDLAIHFNIAVQNTTIPADINPSGYTRIGTTQTATGGGYGIRWNQHYKVLVDGETSISGITDAIVTAGMVAVFRITGAGNWSGPQSIGQEATSPSGNVTSKDVFAANTMSPLVIVGAIANETSSGVVMTPTAATAQNTIDFSGGGNWLSAGYIIYNTAPIDINVSGLNTKIAIAGFYFSVI